MTKNLMTKNLMTNKSEGDNRLKCSFCGRYQDQVKKLIAGPSVYICDRCVDICKEVLEAEQQTNTPMEPQDLD
jgi:ATP-dependent Clp protease ATP-binding subunit ClpX